MRARFSELIDRSRASKMKHTLLLTASLLTALAPISASALTYDVFEGSSIQNSIAIARDGDTIRVHQGIFLENIDFLSKKISLIGVDGAEKTIIRGTRGTVVTLGGSSAFMGFTVTGGSASNVAGMSVSGTGTLIVNNIFTENQQGGGGFGAAIGGNNASPFIVGNLFTKNSSDNQLLSGAVSFVNGSSPFIGNNIFFNNQGRGLNLTLPAGNTPVVTNNTFVGNTSAIRVDERVDTSTDVFRNNLVYGNLMGLQVDLASPSSLLTWDHNLVFGNGINYGSGTGNFSKDYTGTSGNISVDPEFVDVSAGNFRLKLDSPAIDAGTFLDSLGYDFSGTIRPDGGIFDGSALPDIGAFEFVPSPVPEPSTYGLLTAGVLAGLIVTRRVRRNRYLEVLARRMG